MLFYIEYRREGIKLRVRNVSDSLKRIYISYRCYSKENMIETILLRFDTICFIVRLFSKFIPENYIVRVFFRSMFKALAK